METLIYTPDWKSQQRQFEKKRNIYPVLLAMQAEYYRERGYNVVWDPKDVHRYWYLNHRFITEPEDIPFKELPAPDRIWTKAFDKKYQSNGNFKYHPGTYIQVADGCWWGKCSFCVESKRKWQVRPVDSVIEELKTIQRLGFKEVFDDSGTFPTGEWLGAFIDGVNRSNLVLKFGSNMRALDLDYTSLRNIGFRMLLFGIESANQNTLDKINKGVKIEEAIKNIKKAAKAGIECHGAFIFGYPWESEEEAENTLRLAHELLKDATLSTAQASFYTPFGRYGNENHRKYVRRLFEVAKSPKFWFNKIRSIKNIEDIKYLGRQIRDGLERCRAR